MTSGRKPKPTHLKLITGNPGKRPLKPDAIRPPARKTVLAPPSFLSREAKTEWKRLAPMLSRLGLLSDMDRGPFAAYCQAYGRWKFAEDALADFARKDENRMGGLLVKTTNGNAIQNPLLNIANKAMHDMVRHASEFGFTPSARARVQDGAPAAAKSAPGQFFDD